jgi:hypothetical protein
MMAAALTTALVVIVGVYFAGSKRLLGGSSPASIATSAGGTAPTVGATKPAGSSAIPSTATAANSAPAAASIYDCPNSFTSDLYTCMSEAKYSGGVLTIAFKANFTLSAGQDINSHHFHLYLANPGANGGTDPADAVMEHIGPKQGNWWNIYSNGTTTLDDTSKSSNGKKLSAEIGKYSLFCVRVAAGLHTLQKDKKGGFASGNCAKIVK